MTEFRIDPLSIANPYLISEMEKMFGTIKGGVNLLLQLLRMPDIIGIQKSDPLTVGTSDSAISCMTYTSILLEPEGVK